MFGWPRGLCTRTRTIILVTFSSTPYFILIYRAVATAAAAANYHSLKYVCGFTMQFGKSPSHSTRIRSKPSSAIPCLIFFLLLRSRTYVLRDVTVASRYHLLESVCSRNNQNSEYPFFFSFFFPFFLIKSPIKQR